MVRHHRTWNKGRINKNFVATRKHSDTFERSLWLWNFDLNMSGCHKMTSILLNPKGIWLETPLVVPGGRAPSDFGTPVLLPCLGEPTQLPV